MIPTILIFSLALYWLLRESDYLRVRLSGTPELKSTGTTRYLPAIPHTFNYKPLINEVMITPEPKRVLLLDTYHVKPSQFIPLEMPEFTGTINIPCIPCQQEVIND